MTKKMNKPEDQNIKNTEKKVEQKVEKKKSSKKSPQKELKKDQLIEALNLKIKEGVLAVIEIEHDSLSLDVPPIRKGTDGRALR